MNLNNETFFKMLSDNTRLRALLLMQKMGELCVCELTHALNLSQPKISRHLAQLREHGIVNTRRDGQWMYYQINSQLPVWALLVLQQTLHGIGESGQFNSDFLSLNAMTNQKKITCCN
ncbi:MAG: metalloregulator ArsR/SmtB family transcription factor [Pseudomonadota bacterium]